LKSLANKHPEKFVAIQELLKFNKVKKLCTTADEIIQAVKGISDVVEFSTDQEYIRKVGIFKEEPVQVQEVVKEEEKQESSDNSNSSSSSEKSEQSESDNDISSNTE